MMDVHLVILIIDCVPTLLIKKFNLLDPLAFTQTSLATDEEGGLQDQLLPIVVGLLRTVSLLPDNAECVRSYRNAFF